MQLIALSSGELLACMITTLVIGVGMWYYLLYALVEDDEPEDSEESGINDKPGYDKPGDGDVLNVDDYTDRKWRDGTGNGA